MTPQDWTTVAPRFAEAWDGLDISNDDFIRTTEPRHAVAVQEFLGRIHDNGFIYKDIYRGLYCVPCERYYADELSRRSVPDHGPGRGAGGGELLLPAERLRAALDDCPRPNPTS